MLLFVESLAWLTPLNDADKKGTRTCRVKALLGGCSGALSRSDGGRLVDEVLYVESLVVEVVVRAELNMHPVGGRDDRGRQGEVQISGILCYQLLCEQVFSRIYLYESTAMHVV